MHLVAVVVVYFVVPCWCNEPRFVVALDSSLLTKSLALHCCCCLTLLDILSAVAVAVVDAFGICFGGYRSVHRVVGLFLGSDFGFDSIEQTKHSVTNNTTVTVAAV